MKKLGLLLAVVMLLGACASPTPEATPAPTSIPAPTDTPALLATPTSPALTETSFIEPIRKQIYRELEGVEHAEVAKRWGISVDAAEEIVLEGREKGWLIPKQAEATPEPVEAAPTPIPPALTATPIPPAAIPAATPIPPTAPPDFSAEEEAYLSQFYEIIGIYEDSSHDFALLEQEIFSGFQLGGIAGWDSRFEVVNETIRQTGERVQGLEPPARYKRVHQELEQASQYVQGASNALLTGAREQAAYRDTWDRDLDEYSHRSIGKAKQKLALASESMMRAKLEQQSALPAAQISYLEIAYLRTVGGAPVCFVNAEIAIKSLIREMARNPYVRGDRSWQGDVVTARALFLKCNNQLRGLNPPPRFTDIHGDLIRCGNFYFSAAYDYYTYAIEELVPKAIEYGDEAMKQGADCFEQAFDEIDEMFGL